MALGAAALDVIALVLKSSGVALAAGLLLGAAGTRFITGARQLPARLEPARPLTYLGVGAMLVCAGAMATYLPARRATRIDPLRALRCD